MAHACDYPSRLPRNLSKLQLSNSFMNTTIVNQENVPYNLISNFLSNNPNWSLDSLYTYCLATYADYGVTRDIIASCVHNYIMAKPESK